MLTFIRFYAFIFLSFLLLKKIPSPLLSYGLYGFFEFTNSTLYFVNHLSQLSFAILLIILSFSSLSVYTQVYLLAPSLRIRKILKKDSFLQESMCF